MTPAEHYVEAERLLERSRQHSDRDTPPGMGSRVQQYRATDIAEAHVHALLALVAL